MASAPLSSDTPANRLKAGGRGYYLGALFAPDDRRDGLMALFALGLELVRIGDEASEPMLAAIKYQWWREALAEIDAGGPGRRHPVLEDLPKGLDLEPVVDGFEAALQGSDAVRAAIAGEGELFVRAARWLSCDEVKARKAGTLLALSRNEPSAVIEPNINGLLADVEGRVEEKAALPLLLPIVLIKKKGPGTPLGTLFAILKAALLSKI